MDRRSSGRRPVRRHGRSGFLSQQASAVAADPRRLPAPVSRCAGDAADLDCGGDGGRSPPDGAAQSVERQSGRCDGRSAPRRRGTSPSCESTLRSRRTCFANRSTSDAADSPKRSMTGRSPIRKVVHEVAPPWSAPRISPRRRRGADQQPAGEFSVNPWSPRRSGPRRTAPQRGPSGPTRSKATEITSTSVATMTPGPN